MGGHGHDRAGAIAHQHVVGDVDGDLQAVHRVGDGAAGEDAVLALLLALDGRATGGLAGVGLDLGLLGQAGDKLRHRGVLGRQHEEGRTEKRVGPRREDIEVEAESGDAEGDARALRAADPVALHRQHPLGPVLDQLHLVEQLLGVVGDLEEPLLERARLDLGAAALALALDDLLVGQHGLVVRAPVDGRLTLVGEPLFEEAQEQPLCPAVVLRLAGRDLARPVDRPAHALHLLPDARDVAAGDGAGMAALLDCRVLGRQTERVIAHRSQHAEAVAAAEVRDHVAERVVLDVPHVQLARGVRQHLQDVGVLAGRFRGAGGRVGHDECVVGSPAGLPLLLDRLGLVPLPLAVLAHIDPHL